MKKKGPRGKAVYFCIYAYRQGDSIVASIVSKEPMPHIHTQKKRGLRRSSFTQSAICTKETEEVQQLAGGQKGSSYLDL